MYDRRKVFPYFSLLLHVNHSKKHTQVKLHISSSYVKVCLCTLPLLPIVTACHDNATNDEPDKAPVRRTVLIYMAAQNSLHKKRTKRLGGDYERPSVHCRQRPVAHVC